MALVLALGAPCGDAAAAGQVAAEAQAAIVKKILAYVKGEAASDHVLVAGVDRDKAEAMVAAFAALKVPAQALAPSDAAKKLTASSVVYLMDDGWTPELASACVDRRGLTVTNRGDLVEAGKAAVGIVLKADGRPQIIVHTTRARQEGKELSAKLLQLARVIK